MRPRQKTLTGTARMVANGKRPSQLWYTADDYAIVAEAARLDRRPLATFAVIASVAAAKRFLLEAGWKHVNGKLTAPAEAIEHDDGESTE